MTESRPFWEKSYSSGDETATFGTPSAEVVELSATMDRGARVLDLGCGDGRHALYLARRGCNVTAIDISATGVNKLTRLAGSGRLPVRAELADMRDYVIDGDYDLVIAHGCLHLVPRPEWMKLIPRMKNHTRPGGYNVVAVFTDALPSPDDLRAIHVGLFREGELFEQYIGWEIHEARSYVLEDEHPGGIRHRHPINKLVARRPG
jgi:tellurite methyltransferase